MGRFRQHIIVPLAAGETQLHFGENPDTDDPGGNERGMGVRRFMPRQGIADNRGSAFRPSIRPFGLVQAVSAQGNTYLNPSGQEEIVTHFIAGTYESPHTRLLSGSVTLF